ncbi:MAG: hypothetical protein JJE42_10205 [Burkholderiales bacterium]|nr:hypothetical protein [Burkholderiales bacterium]
MALKLPTLAPDKKQLPTIVGGVIVLAAAGWFGWQYLNEEPPPPPAPIRKPQPVTAAKPKVKAPSPADIEKAQVKLSEDVLAASGLKQQLDQLPQTLAASVRQSGKPQKKAAPALKQAIEDALAEAFAAGEFHAKVSANLKKNFDQKRLQALLKDFSTPTARSMIEMERSSAAPEERAKFARSTAATKLPPQRAELIKRIDAATRASELAVAVASSTVNALALGMAGENARKSAAMDKKIEKQRAATAQKIRDATLLNLAFGYKDASDADLEKYAGIYEAENSKWLYGLVYESLLDEVKVASAEAAKRIGEMAIKPAASTQTLASAMTGADARACLRLETNTAIIKCAEAYR